MGKSKLSKMGKYSKDPMYFINLNDGEIDYNLADKKYKKQILRFGKWLYEDAENGEFEVTKDKAEEMVKNFKEKVIENVPVTRGHVSQEEVDKNPDLIAGYVEDLALEEDGVYAIIKTVDDDADNEIAKKYKNVSASIDSNYQDHESGGLLGWVMRHLALVTEPYIKRLNPNFIALSDEYNKEIVSINLDDMKDEKQAEVVVPEVVVPETPVVEEVKPVVEEPKTEEVEKPKEVVEPVVEPVVEEKKETIEEIEERIRNTIKEEIKKELLEEAKKEKEDEEKKEEEDKSEKEVDGAEKEPKKLEGQPASDTKLSKLEQSLKLAEGKIKQLELKETESEVEVFINKGIVLPAQKETALSLLRNKSVVNLAEGKSDSVSNMFRAFLTNTPPLVDLSEKGVPPKTKEERERPKTYLGIDPKEMDRLNKLYPTKGVI